ncbi:MAG: DUF4157 domain-containing protein [Moorea sp. SIO3C2]|nr:DUF4157 domain-containing protein [Moorena sp. SIO3C2]
MSKGMPVAQGEGGMSDRQTPVQRQEEGKKAENKTGLPDGLKEGIESLSGFDLSGVRVNYNSPKPAQLNAHAYTQGQAIEVAPGQARHLPHEAWHVVQQKQGRVRPTKEVMGYRVNDDQALEREADVMGKRADQMGLTNDRSKEGIKPGSDPAPRRNLNPIIGNSKKCQTSFSHQAHDEVQRVKIGDENITSQTDPSQIIEKLGWSENYGITINITIEQKQELLLELRKIEPNRQTDQIKQLVEQLDEDLNEESEEEEWSDWEEEGEIKGAWGGVDENPVEEHNKRMDQIVSDFNWPSFPMDTKGKILIGVHQTNPKNLESLVKHGPSKDKMGTGHGLGKGQGFYVSYVGKKSLSTVVKAVDYGEGLVAVYLPKKFSPKQMLSSEGNNVTEYEGNSENEKADYYIMSGGSEIVIPERNFKHIKLVTKPEQLK